MELIDITNLSNEELEELLNSATNEKQRRAEVKLAEAEKAFEEAARTLYNIDPWYTFPIYASDLEEIGELTLGLLVQEMKRS